VDNSNAEDSERAARLERDDIRYLFNGNAGGIAGAHNRGLEKLFSEGLDAVMLLDQDSRLGPDFVSRMTDACTALAGTPFAIGPRIYDENDGRFLPELYMGRFAMRLVRIEPGMAPQPCSLLVSSGLVVSREAYDVLGGFDELMFIDQVDTEYCIRAMTRSVQTYVHPGLVLAHRIGKKRWHRLGPLRFVSWNHAAFRRYYIARNGVYLSRRYITKLPTPAFVPNLFTVGQLIQILLFEMGKRDKALAIVCGWADGLVGRMGPLETARPKLAARLALGNVAR
jgi:rhamnosyltransferase